MRVISHLLIVIELLLSYGVGAAVVVGAEVSDDDGASVGAAVVAVVGAEVLFPPPVAANLTVIV